MNPDRITDRFEDLVQLAIKRGATASKVSFSRTVSDGCEFENGRLKNIGAGESISYTIRTLVSGKMGVATGNVPEQMEDILARALVMAKKGSPAHFKEYPAPDKIADIKVFAQATADLSTEKMVEDCEGMIETIKTYDPDLFIGAGAGKYVSENMLVTSGGLRHSKKSSRWAMGAHTQRTEGSDMLFTYFGRSWCDASNHYDPSQIAQRNITDLTNGKRIAKINSGRYPILLNTGLASKFLAGILLGVNGRNVAKGESPLIGKLKSRVLASDLTVIDNPHIDYSPTASTIDADGVPTGKHVIFDKGELQMFLYDLDTAGLTGMEPTGHCGCSPYHFYAEPGSENSEGMIASMKNGLYVKDLIGFGQSNLINGDFSANVGLGFKIENGEIVGRVKDVMVSGNLYDVLGGDISVSSDSDPLTRMPYILTNRINVSTGN